MYQILGNTCFSRTKSIVKRTKYGPNKPQKHELWRNMGRNMGVFDQNNRVFATATDQTLLIYGKSLNRWYATPITAKSERWTRFWSKYGWYFSNIRPIDDLKTMNYWRHRWVYRPNTSVLNQSGRESNPWFLFPKHTFCQLNHGKYTRILTIGSHKSVIATPNTKQIDDSRPKNQPKCE